MQHFQMSQSSNPLEQVLAQNGERLANLENTTRKRTIYKPRMEDLATGIRTRHAKSPQEAEKYATWRGPSFGADFIKIANFDGQPIILISAGSNRFVYPIDEHTFNLSQKIKD